jgi:hypothetical protein
MLPYKFTVLRENEMPDFKAPPLMDTHKVFQFVMAWKAVKIEEPRK